MAGLYIYKRCTGTDILKMIVMSCPVVVALTAVIEALYKLVPSETLRVIKTILNATVDATQFAEKAWLAGDLAREERNPKAKELAREVLEKAGIDNQMQWVHNFSTRVSMRTIPLYFVFINNNRQLTCP